MVLYIAMLIAFAAMLWANQQYKTKGVPWGRPVAGLFGIAAVVLAGSALYGALTKNQRQTDKIIERENEYTRISYERLGDYLGNFYPDKKLVILKQSFGETNEREMLVMNALKAGLKDRMEITVVPLGDEMDPNNPEMDMMGPEYMLTPEKFEEILHENVPGYRLHKVMTKDEREKARGKDLDGEDPKVEGDPRSVMVLSLVGLPMEYENLPLWYKKEEDRPFIALVNANLYGMKDKIHDAFVNVVMTNNPDAVYDPEATIPDSESAAFDERYLLITDLTAEDVATKYPMIFGEE